DRLQPVALGRQLVALLLRLGDARLGLLELLLEARDLLLHELEPAEQDLLPLLPLVALLGDELLRLDPLLHLQPGLLERRPRARLLRIAGRLGEARGRRRRERREVRRPVPHVVACASQKPMLTVIPSEYSMPFVYEDFVT